MSKWHEESQKTSKKILLGLGIVGTIGLGIVLTQGNNDSNNTLDSKVDSTQIVVQEPEKEFYIVQKGDNPNKIAKNLGVDYQKIQEYNPQINNWKKISPGDTVYYRK
ncbi:MAG: LysM peptidoglycan-binding domain-containing protein [Nanoarchaeota archaeon]|nr:LysM peptidoglycan-binding domain-containing protein [Nanoarchaeota archaeon]